MILAMVVFPVPGGPVRTRWLVLVVGLSPRCCLS